MRIFKGHIFFSFLFALFLLTSCEAPFLPVATYTAIPGKTNLPSSDTVMTDSISGIKFSRLTKVGVGGIAVKHEFKQEQQNKPTWVVFSGRLRSNYVHSNSSITISGSDPTGQNILWKAVFLKYHLVELNRWMPFRDSVLIPPSYDNKLFQTIYVFTYMGGKPGENFDLDTLRVLIKQQL